MMVSGLLVRTDRRQLVTREDDRPGLMIVSLHLSVLCLMQASQQGPSVQVIIQQSASVAQSVSPGHLVEALCTASTALP